MQSTLLALALGVASGLHATPTLVAPRGRLAAVRAAPAQIRLQADFGALAKYPLATAGEFCVIATALKAVDALPLVLPTFAVPPLFFFLSLRSRIFSFIPARRPDRDAQGGAPTPQEVHRRQNGRSTPAELRA